MSLSRKKATERAISIREPYNTGGNTPIEIHRVIPIEIQDKSFPSTRQSLFPLKQRKNFLVEPFPEMQLKESTPTKV